MKTDIDFSSADEPSEQELMAAIRRSNDVQAILDRIGGVINPPPAVTIETLTVELADARRRLKAVESVLLAKIADEFHGDARRMAREILDLRMALESAKCLR